MPHYVGYEQYRKHWLFRAVRRVVFERADGWCEYCRSAPPTEDHHDAYPVWGAFDTPGNMKAVCHRCHCERHGELFDQGAR